MINPLKKKTKQHSETMGLLDMANKVDELVKVFNKILQAKEDPENIIKAYNDLLDRQHEGKTEEASNGKCKKPKGCTCPDWQFTILASCPVHGIDVPKSNPPESDGECPHCDEKHIDGYAHNPKTCFMCRDNPPEHKCDHKTNYFMNAVNGCKVCSKKAQKALSRDGDPEHEEDFDRLAQGLRNHVIDDVRFSGLFEYVKDYILKGYVSKEKIKNLATQMGMRSSAKIVQLKTLNRLQIEDIIYDKILESLGLGD